MPGRPRKITPMAIKLAREVLTRFPGNPQAQNREIQKTLKVSPSTRKRIMRQARAGGKKKKRTSLTAQPKKKKGKTAEAKRTRQALEKHHSEPSASVISEEGEPATGGGLLAEIERARVANIAFYESIRDGVNPADKEKIWPSHRLQAAKALDKIYAFYPLPPDKALSPEEQCVEVQEAMDAALGVGFTVTVAKPKKKGKKK